MLRLCTSHCIPHPEAKIKTRQLARMHASNMSSGCVPRTGACSLFRIPIPSITVARVGRSTSAAQEWLNHAHLHALLSRLLVLSQVSWCA